MATSPRALPGASIAGAVVVTDEGTALGWLEDVVVDARSGQVAYAVLSLGASFGVADKLVAVPWQALRPDGARVVFAAPVETLQGAPGFDRDRRPDPADERFRHAVRVHYGLAEPTLVA